MGCCKVINFKRSPTLKEGRPSFENEMPESHHGILSIVLPEITAEERQRSEIYKIVCSLDDLKEELDKRGYHLKSHI